MRLKKIKDFAAKLNRQEELQQAKPGIYEWISNLTVVSLHSLSIVCSGA